MKAFLKSSAYVTTADMSGGSRQVPTSSTSSCNSTSSASQTQHSPSSDFTDQLQGSNIIPTSDSQTDVELGEIVSHPPLLLSCLEKGRYAVELRQESIIGVADDRQLFYTLRRMYHEHRGRLRPMWSLKTLHSIHFMKVSRPSPTLLICLPRTSLPMAEAATSMFDATKKSAKRADLVSACLPSNLSSLKERNMTVVRFLQSFPHLSAHDS